jgi:cell division protein FtsB
VGDRRRPAKAWDDLTLFPTLVAQKRVPSYAELARNVAASARECEQLRAENDCLRAAMASLEQRLEALVSADAASKADTIVILTQAEDAVSSLIARLRALTS